MKNIDNFFTSFKPYSRIFSQNDPDESTHELILCSTANLRQSMACLEQYTCGTLAVEALTGNSNYYAFYIDRMYHGLYQVTSAVEYNTDICLMEEKTDRLLCNRYETMTDLPFGNTFVDVDQVLKTMDCEIESILACKHMSY